MIPYILHVSILIAAGVLFYRLALKRLTFYVLNRWVLLSCLVAAFLLPLLPVPRVLSWWAREAARPEATVVETAAKPSTSAIVETAVAHPKTIVEQETIAQQEAIAKPAAAAGSAATAKPATTVRPEPSARPDVTVDSKSPVASRNTARLLFYLYLSGVVILGLNLLRQMIQLLLQRYKGPVIRDGHYRIVTRAGMQGPCSFGNIIFIHPSEYDPETYQQILLHEKIHAGGWHTLDILLAELGIIFQWFNPFI